ncbi:transposase, partial [Planctomycetota bacterium]
LKALRTRKDPENRLYWKMQVAKSLYRRGFTREKVLELFRLIDWLMALPEELERTYTREILCHEEETHMPYITSFERLGRKDGRGEDRLDGCRESMVELLEARFGDVPTSVVEAVRSVAGLSALDQVLRHAVQAASLEEFQQRLHNMHTGP